MTKKIENNHEVPPNEAYAEYDKLNKQYRVETDAVKKEELRQQCLTALSAKRKQ